MNHKLHKRISFTYTYIIRIAVPSMQACSIKLDEMDQNEVNSYFSIPIKFNFLVHPWIGVLKLTEVSDETVVFGKHSIHCHFLLSYWQENFMISGSFLIKLITMPKVGTLYLSYLTLTIAAYRFMAVPCWVEYCRWFTDHADIGPYVSIS